MWLLGSWLVGCVEVAAVDAGVRRAASAPVAEAAPVDGRAALAVSDPAGCAAEPPPELDVPLDERVYGPSEIDPALASAPFCGGDPLACGVGDPFPWKRHHVKIPASGATREELVLFLPGTAGECDKYEVVPRIAAAAGHAAICLAYPNEEMVEAACARSDDPQCAQGYRSEVLTGEDHSPLVALTPPNAITGRLEALLRALAAEDPANDWARFLGADGVRWDRVVAIGFSQGAGYVGLLGRDVRLARAILLSGGGDRGPDGFADWLFDPRATPAEATFLYWHTEEPIAPDLEALAELWVGDPPVDADARAYPFDCARVLTTSRPVEEPHGSVAWDPHLPLGEDGWPVDADVHLWQLLGGP